MQHPILKTPFTDIKCSNGLFRLVFCSFLFFLSTAAHAQNEPFDLIMKRITDDLQTGVSDKILADKVSKTLALLDADGAWKDVSYGNDVQYQPLGRINEMATAYTRPANQFYNNSSLYAAIVKAFQNWLEKDPKNKNWWFNDIFYPQAIGKALILMRSARQQLPAGLEKALTLRMIRKLRPGDGANTSDEALHYLYRACLTQNKATLDSAAKYLFEPIAISDDKGGVQIDYSYYQHGKQQAIASYGRVFVGNSVNAAFYLRGTDYALPEAQLNILLNYLKNTFLQTIRGSFYDFNVRGRGISRKDSLNANVSATVKKVMALDPDNKAFWQASAQRTAGQKSAGYAVKNTHNQYWKSSYTLHVRPAYTFSVQASSVRTLRTERGNNENILGKFLSDGATNIQRSGSEYANLMPIWEWDKIPGTTSRDYPSDSGATIQKEWGIEGSTRFSGGVSDGLYGASAYDLDHDGVKAKKAWFFFDREVVCLGAGISSDAEEHITTTINQSWLRGNVLTDTTGNKTRIVHDSIVYYVAQDEEVKLTQQTQSGSWYRINQFQPKNSRAGKVFKLWIDHGQKPKNATYAYTVVPKANLNKPTKNEMDMIKILKNTEDVQAVKHTGLDMLQVVFYKAGALTADNLYLKVDNPCVVYIKSLHTAEPILYIADPSHENANIKVEVRLQQKHNKFLSCKMPVGAMAGSTASFKIN